jgi:hypothetical protein
METGGRQVDGREREGEKGKREGKIRLIVGSMEESCWGGLSGREKIYNKY